MKRLIAALACCQLIGAQESDVLLRAMRDELDRSRKLSVANLDPPYFIQYSVEDADMLSIHSSLGALVTLSHNKIRVPTISVRVGSFAFDNGNHVYSTSYSGTRYDSDQLPIENNYLALRRALWLGTDRAYKTAEEAIGRKRSALRDVNLAEQYPDYSAAEPVQAIQPVKRLPLDEAVWKPRIVNLSSIFSAYPHILSSGLEFEGIQATTYLTNSEGTALRTPENLSYLRIRAFAQAPDGMNLRNSETVQVSELERFPADAELKRNITAVADELTALAAAPLGDMYDGPILFEPRAAAQLFGQVLGDNLKITRKPVGERGRQSPHLPSELETKVGARILPEWIDVADDPSQTEWRGQPLFGHYEFDVEGVRPKPLTLVDKGVLKTFLLTRTPVMKGFVSSNGHARMHGSFGAAAPGFGNLFVRASQTVNAAALKQKLIDSVKQRNKPYGMLIRKLDYPSGMSTEELRRVMSAMLQSGGGTRPVAPPLLAYRVYPDGREELVRGLRFRGVSTRSFRDIVAASDQTYVLNFLDSTVPFALMGVGSFVTNASVIAPGLLFEDLELEPSREDLPKLPIVPPPTL